MPAYDLHEYEPLLDSSNMRPADWVRIGRDIVEHYEEYDGFVVLHGTDTMAYTASALPFFIRGLAKPVIITGSQIPLSEVRNDARNSLVTSMLIASGRRGPGGLPVFRQQAAARLPGDEGTCGRAGGFRLAELPAAGDRRRRRGDRPQPRPTA